MLRIFYISLILTEFLFCVACAPRSEVLNSKLTSQFVNDRSNLSTETFEKLGYQIKSFTEGSPNEWKKDQFKTLWLRSYQIKSNTSLKEESDTFPRYTVTEEVYETEALAAERLRRIQEKPQDLPIEEREYWMVTGFQHHKNVYFIQTDSVVFLYYMKDFAYKLAEEINKK